MENKENVVMRIPGVSPEVVKTAEGHVIGVFLNATDYEKVATMVEGKGYVARPPRSFDRDGGPRREFRKPFNSEGGEERPFFKKEYSKFSDRSSFGDRDRSSNRFGGDREGGFRKPRRRFDEE